MIAMETIPRIGRGLGVVLVVTVLLAGCQVGPRAENHPAPHSPRGSPVMVEHEAGRFRGELLEVRDDGLLVWSERRVLFVQYARIRTADFTFVGVSLRGGTGPSDRQRERLRLVSRFPYGLAPGPLSELLEASSQTAVDELDP